MTKKKIFLTVQSRGIIAIPPDIKRRYGLDIPGAQVEVIERDGELVLLPHIPLPVDQTWFWSERWQRMEAEADTAIAEGKTISTDDVDRFLNELEE